MELVQREEKGRGKRSDVACGVLEFSTTRKFLRWTVAESENIFFLHKLIHFKIAPRLKRARSAADCLEMNKRSQET